MTLIKYLSTRWLAVLTVCATLAGAGKVFAQSSPSTTPLMPVPTEIEEERRSALGIFGGYNLNYHTLNFSELPNFPCCSPGYKNADGGGLAIGLLFESPLSNAFAFHIGATYSQNGAKTTVRELIGYQLPSRTSTGAPVKLETDHTFESKIANIGLEPRLMIRPIPGANLDINLGFAFNYVLEKKFSESEKMVNPGVVFLSGKNERNTYVDQDVPDSSNFSGTLSFGASYDIMLGSSFAFAPEVTYFFPLTNVAQGTEWKASSLRLGAALKFFLGEADPDLDKDGLTNSMERAIGTDPRNPDTDGDGLRDGDEVNKWKTDPKKYDSDNDGLSDGEEVNKYKTDALKPDTDGDGLRDGAEVTTYATDPLKTDTDNDGLNDADEVNRYRTDPTKADTDGDTLKDGDEVNRTKTDPLKPDTDGDTVPDNEDRCPLKPGVPANQGCPAVTAPTGTPDAPPLPPAKRGTKLNVNKIYFIKGKAEFDFGRPETQADLNRLKAFLDQCDQIQVSLGGHTSKEGAAKTNQKLSADRAAAVKKWLLNAGVPASKIPTTQGYGSTKPAVNEPAPNSKQAKAMDAKALEDIRSQNRRIEATVLKECP